MTDTRKVVLATETDASGAKRGFEEVKQGAREMARDVAQQGAVAGKGVDAIGTGAQGAAAKIERETRGIIASIERATAAAKAGGRGTAEFYESLALQRGLDPNGQLAPYLANLRQAQQLQQQATGSLNTMGMSARQTNQALAQLPLQFQDIVVSLQGGQQPLSVLLQQGTQIAGSFGGAGAAIQAMGRYVLGLVTPLTAAGAALAVVTAGFVLGRREAEDFARSIILTGNAAGATVGQLSAIAAALDNTTSATQGRASEVLSALVSTGQVAASQLQRVAAAAIELERVGGPAVEETVKAFADLGRDPLQASVRLNESTNFLTVSLYEQIRALEQQGRTLEAGVLAQEAYAAAIEQRAPAIVDQLGFVERGWRAIVSASKEAIDAVKDIGRADGIGEQIAALQDRIQQLQGNNVDPRRGRLAERAIAPLREELAALQELERFQRRAADAEAERARQVKARIDFDKAGDAFLDKRARMEREVAEARLLGVTAGKSQAEIEQRIADIRAKYAERPRGGDGAAQREQEATARLLLELSGLTGSYTQDLARLDAQLGANLITEARYGELVRELVDRQPFRRRAVQEQTAAEREAARAAEQAARSYRAWVTELNKGAEAVEQQVSRARDEEAALRLVTERNISLAEAIQEVAIARLEERKASMVGPLSEEEAAAIDREIAARRRLIAQSRDRQLTEAAQRTARDASAAWERESERIADALTQALMDGGKSGWDYVRGYVRSAVLRPIIQPVGNLIAGTIQQTLGLPGAAQAAGSLGSGFNLFGMGAGLGAFGSAFSAGSALTMTGFTGTQLALQGAGSMIGNGSVLAGLGQGLGAVTPYLAAAAAIYSIARAMDDSGTPHSGSVVNVSAMGDTLRARTVWGDGSQILDNYSEQTDTALRAITQASVGAINTVDRLFGGAGGVTALTKFAADGRDPSIGSFELARANGQVLGQVGSRSQFAFFDRNAGEGLRQFSRAVALQTIGALDELNLPSWARRQVAEAVDALADNATAEEVLQTLGSVTQAIGAMQTGMVSLQRIAEPLGGSFVQLARLSGDALSELIGFAGGLDNLGSQIAGFAQNYLTRDEIAGLRAREVLDTLTGAGFSAQQLAELDTRGEFRGLVEGVDVNTEAGRRQLAALLGVQGSFAELSDFFGQTGLTLSSAAALAPNTGVFGEPGAAVAPQVDATNAVRDSVDALGPKLDRLADLLQTDRTVVINVPAGREVNWIDTFSGG